MTIKSPWANGDSAATTAALKAAKAAESVKPTMTLDELEAKLEELISDGEFERVVLAKFQKAVEMAPKVLELFRDHDLSDHEAWELLAFMKGVMINAFGIKTGTAEVPPGLLEGVFKTFTTFGEDYVAHRRADLKKKDPTK